MASFPLSILAAPMAISSSPETRFFGKTGFLNFTLLQQIPQKCNASSIEVAIQGESQTADSDIVILGV